MAKKTNNLPAYMGVVNTGVACVLSMMFPAVRNTAIIVSWAQLNTDMQRETHPHTHTLKTVLKVQSTTERVVAWLRSTGVFKSLMDTYFGQFERFPPVLFAHRQSVTFLKTNMQQINISNFVPAKISLTSEIMTWLGELHRFDTVQSQQ